MPHFDQYAPYIWWAYGIVITVLASASLYIIAAYWRARCADKKAGVTDER